MAKAKPKAPETAPVEADEVEETGTDDKEETVLRQQGDLLVATIRGKQFKFRIPKDRPAVLIDLVVNEATNPLLVRSAAVGLCWFGLRMPKARQHVYLSPFVFGEAVANELLLGGWQAMDIATIGAELIARAAMSLPTSAEEEKEQGFFG